MEIANRKNHSHAIPCPRSYGLKIHNTYSKRMHDARDKYRDPFTNRTLAKGQFDWFILKGDLLLAEESREIERPLMWNFQKNDRKVCKVCLFEYLDDDLPDRFETAQEGSFRNSSSPAVQNTDLWVSQKSIRLQHSSQTCRIKSSRNSKNARIKQQG